MAAIKSRRVELRTDPETDELIGEAADLLQMTKSAFVADAARRAAKKVVARADLTIMAEDVFDAMIVSLHVPDDAPGLAKLADLPRVIGR